MASVKRPKIARICELLTETDLPLKEISARAGFAHVEYMSVVFKRMIGGAPGAVDSQHLGIFGRQPARRRRRRRAHDGFDAGLAQLGELLCARFAELDRDSPVMRAAIESLGKDHIVA